MAEYFEEGDPRGPAIPYDGIAAGFFTDPSDRVQRIVPFLGAGASLPIEMKKNAVACVSFERAPRPGRAALKWLATPRMLRALR